MVDRNPHAFPAGEAGEWGPRALAMWAALLLWAPAAASRAGDDSVATVAGGTDPSWMVGGSAIEEYRGRFAASSDAGDADQAAPAGADHKLRLLLDGEAQNPQDTFAVQLSLGLWFDADGYHPYTPADLGSLVDYGRPVKPVWFDAFIAQAELHRLGRLRLLRGGRQVAEHGEPVVFDGAALEVSGARWLDLFVFGGRTAHFFETQAEVFEDWVGSAGAQARLGKNVRLEVDYRFSREDVLADASGPSQTVNRHGYGVKFDARNLGGWKGQLWVRGLDDALSRAGLRGRFDSPSRRFGAGMALEVQPITLYQQNERDDPLFAILGPSQPNLRYRLDAWVAFEPAWARMVVRLAWNGRAVLSGPEGPFNRSFGRAALAFEARDLGWPGLYLDLSAEGHYLTQDGALASDWHMAAAGSIGYQGRRIKAEVGTAYARFRYDYYRSVREISDVRSFLGTLSWKMLDWFSLRLRYDLDWTDFWMHTVTVAAVQAF